MIQYPVNAMSVSVSVDRNGAESYPGSTLLPSAIAVFAESGPEHTVAKYDGLKGFSDFCAVDLARDADGDTLVEPAGSLVSVGSMLEIQILDGGQRKIGDGGCTRTSDLLLLFVVGECRPLCKFLNGFGLDDVLETDRKALLSGL